MALHRPIICKKLYGSRVRYREMNGAVGHTPHRKVILAQVGLESFGAVVQSANQFTRCMMEHLCKASW